MFSIIPQKSHQQNLSVVQSKRQTFRNQIRKKRLHEYKSKLRAQLFYDNEVNFDLLRNINLNFTMQTIANYDFPIFSAKGQQINIDDCLPIFDLQRPENQKFKKAVQELFLYTTSSMKSHALCMLEQTHIFRLLLVLEKKVEEMKPQFKEKSYKQLKKADNLYLPQVYQRVLIILTECSYANIFNFEELIHKVISVLIELLYVFRSQTRIIKCCAYNITALLDKTTVIKRLLQLLNQQKEEKCLLSRFVDILQHEVRYYDPQSYHSESVMQALLYFYEKLLNHTTLNDIYPTMRRKIYKQLNFMIDKQKITDQTLLHLTSTLVSLYNYDYANLNQIVFETEQLVFSINDVLKNIVQGFKKHKINQGKDRKIQTAINCLIILKSIFQDIDAEQMNFNKITIFLLQLYDQQIQVIVQDALKLTQNPILYHTLQLIKIISNWGDFIEKIYDNYNILAKLFYFSNNQIYNLKKQAIGCLCCIVDGYFDGRSCYENQLTQIYQFLIEESVFVNILVQNLDRYADINLNTEILKIIKILCSFWDCESKLIKKNRFWIKLVTNGGYLKLNTIVNEQRNQEMKRIATQILDSFAIQQKQIEI